MEKLAAISSATGGRRIEAPGLVEGAKDLDAFRQEYFTIGTLGALRYVVDGLRELPGRKSVILFSDGLSLWRAERREQRERLLASFRGIIDRANRSLVVMYTFQDWLRKGVIYTQDVPVRKPGAYQLRVAVRDDATGKVGSASEFIEVPDVAQARLVMSGIVLGSAVQAAGPAETARPEKPEDIEGHPALRTFHPGQTLQFGCQLFNAALDPKTSAPNVETRVVLLRDGKAVFIGNSVALNVKGQPNLKRITVTGSVRLGSGLEPGSNVFQLVAQDKLAKEKQAFASQWIDFEVVR